jgi:hypothetical protein
MRFYFSQQRKTQLFEALFLSIVLLPMPGRNHLALNRYRLV